MMPVIIGMDPHKRSATVEIIDDRERVLFAGRFGTDRDGYQAMLAAGRKFKDRTWAAEGRNGIGRHIAQRLVADGEPVVDVPAKLSARRGCSPPARAVRPTRAGAHSVALAGLRSSGLRVIAVDDAMVALRLSADHRDELGVTRSQTISRLHRLLVELFPNGAKKFLSAAQARELLATIRPRDIAGKTRRRLAAGLVTELTRIGKRIKAADAELKELVAATGGTLPDLHGIGPSGAARLLGDVGDIARFAGKGRFASWNSRRAAGCLQRRSEPAPAVAGQQPAAQQGAAHHGDRRVAQRHRRTRLLPAQARRRQNHHGSPAVPEETAVRHCLPADARRRATASNGPGRTTGGVCSFQRGRLTPRHRHFGSVSSRTRHQRA
jgi:hypothetical protein